MTAKNCVMAMLFKPSVALVSVFEITERAVGSEFARKIVERVEP